MHYKIITFLLLSEDHYCPRYKNTNVTIQSGDDHHNLTIDPIEDDVVDYDKKYILNVTSSSIPLTHLINTTIVIWNNDCK